MGQTNRSEHRYDKPLSRAAEGLAGQGSIFLIILLQMSHSYCRPKIRKKRYLTKSVMRTLWVCEVTGGPFTFSPTRPGKTHLGLEEAHRKLKISPAEFDEVAAELGRTLDFAKVPAREKGEVLAAFAAHKDEVTAGFKGK